MQIKSPIPSVILDKRRQYNSGNYPVKLRITYCGKQKYFKTSFNVSEEDFDFAQNPKLIPKGTPRSRKDRLITLGLEMSTILNKAVYLIEQLPRFSFYSFESLYFSKSVEKQDLISMYEDVMETLKSNGQYGTASNYHCSLASLKSFHPEIDFADISPVFLQNYEKWLLGKGKSISTVGIYLRPLRAILNSAIELKLMPHDSYPFGKRRYQIPASRNIKKCLSDEELGLIFNYPTMKGTWWDKAKDFWLCSYFANGINIKDLALLKHTDVQEDYIRFIRAKTQHTSRTNSKEIAIHINEELRKVICKWKTNDGPFLFPIIDASMSEEKKRKAIMQFTKMVNKYIQKIAKEVGITKRVTSYFARHSFATVLFRNGVSTEMISESLGHTSVKTTASYLGTFENDVRRNISEILLKSFTK
jgi:integrase/recombinase XerD